MTATLDDEVVELRRANAELQQRLDQRTAERDEAQAEKAAMAEVLEVINSSSGDLQPVFDTMLEKAMRLCEADFGFLHTWDGERVNLAAKHGLPARFVEFAADPGNQPGPGGATPRLLAGAHLVHISDLKREEAYRSGDPYRVALVELGGARTLLAVPLRKDGAFVGQIAIYRQEVRPYSEEQIALLQNFAAQAVIAMENARLLTETREALDQQTATAEVLQVINSSPADLTPVFDAILEKAMRLCEAAFGAMLTFDGAALTLVAQRGLPLPFAEFAANPDNQPGPGGATPRLIRDPGLRVVHVVDLKEEEAYRSGDAYRRALVDVGGARTLLAIPLRKDGAMVGVINIYRQEVRAYTDKQIALMESFAAQAVIAMENARLITETREALEQQTATAEVLGVINSSPGDLAPVFEAMLDKAASLCEAQIGILFTQDNGSFTAVAWHGTPELFREFLTREPLRPSPDTGLGRMVHERRLIHLTDVSERDSYRRGDPLSVASVELGNIRTFAAAPLVKDDTLVGAFVVYRQEVRPFTDKQTALLENFAAQAVIAIENARLLGDLRERTGDLQEALGYQTATSDVLEVISRSTFDLDAVLQTVVSTAHRLCRADHAVLFRDVGGEYRWAAGYEMAAGVEEHERNAVILPGPGTLIGRAVLEKHAVQIEDAWEDPLYAPQDAARIGGTHSMLGVPLMREGKPIGAIGLARNRVEPFSEREVELVITFADQAVIAIENARLITETREALDQQTATAEILAVINSSPGDLAPVFDAMLEKAMRLCEAGFGFMDTFDGERFRTAAMHGLPAAFADFRMQNPPDYGAGTTPQQILAGDRFVHVIDLKQSDAYRAGEPNRRAVVDLGGARTALVVPLIKDKALLGVICVFRQEVRAFSDKQIALLQNFAAQAVIATENARLITETREALEQQTATSEVLQVINASPGDLTPVFDAMLEKATRLCDAAFGILIAVDGDELRTAAVRNMPERLANSLATLTRLEQAPVVAAVVRSRRALHVHDFAASQVYRDNVPIAVAAVEAGNVRSVLYVPLVKDDRAVGVFVIFRQEVRPFSDKQIALLQNFAAQAVIAIENARLITETREALDQQTATAEVLGVINSSPGDLRPVFDSMLDKAVRLCSAPCAILWVFDGAHFRPAASYGVPEAFAEFLRQGNYDWPSLSLAAIARGQAFVHNLDLADTESYRSGTNRLSNAVVELGHARTGLLVPLQKDGTLLGAIRIFRHEVRAFSDKQIALLQNFAAQAVIAMENARLLGELHTRTDDLQEALEYQTATSDVLKVISASTFDIQPVLQALLETAARLCSADFGGLMTRRGDVYRTAAIIAISPEHEAFVRGRTFVPRPTGSTVERAAFERRIIHIPDITLEPEYAPTTAVFIRTGTALGVPLLREGETLGVITLHRQIAQPFTDRQIELVRTFADQAVIAIENARLITETREALDQQTATAEVLGVINSSPGDLAPVFEAMLEKALNLCEAAFGGLATYDGEAFLFVAESGFPPASTEIGRGMRTLTRPGPETGLGRLAAGERTVHILDLADSDAYRAGDPVRVATVETLGARSGVWVALTKDNVLLGALVAYRKDVRPFTDKQIALLQNFAAQAVIAMENARLITETREALDQQTATAEVLQVINASPGDLAPVFDAMLEKAMRLCEARIGWLLRYQDGKFSFAAGRNLPPECVAYLQHMDQPSPAEGNGKLVAGEPFVHMVEMKDEVYESGLSPFRRAMVDLGGARTGLAMALRKDGRLLGSFNLTRAEVRPFTDKQIALVRDFAAQAVIAMENARLITETREALEQQTATAEVLQVINASPGDLAPVFDAMLQKATNLCDAAFGILWRFDGEFVNAAALYQVPAAFAEFWSEPHRPGPHTGPGRVMRGEGALAIPDLTEYPPYIDGEPLVRAIADLAGARSVVVAPLRIEGATLGAITIYRQEVRPFTDKQIALLENFAAQAAIAMENARLLGELRNRTTDLQESLEYQTATSDVLNVISRSAFDLEPILESVVTTAARLCRAEKAILYRLQEGAYRFAAGHSNEPEYERIERATPIYPGEGTVAGRAALYKRVVQIVDPLADPQYESTEEARIGKARSMIGVPMLRDGVPVGIIALARERIEPFNDRQIELVQTFADQAIIAIENARLIAETQEALDQQTATAEVLGVINSSPGDLSPVFDAMLEKAMRLCDGANGILWTLDGERARLAGSRGNSPEFVELLRQQGESGAHPLLRRVIGGEHLFQLNLPEHEVYRAGGALEQIAIEAGVRTVIWVALVRDGASVGAFVIGRNDLRRFSAKHIALLQNFAAQAVIAMENARLLDEIRQRQAELRVTFDNMADGVVMFDEGLHLAAWNRNFQQMLDLPEDFLAEHHGFDEYIHYLTARGEFGETTAEFEIARLRTRLAEHYSFERTRPDGRVIEVRHNPMPEGGIVLIYSDITERKRSEEEIRAARDAAEAAYRDLRAAQANLVQAEKMASLGQLTAGIAHEIKNPLNFVNNFAGLSVELLEELKEATEPAVATLDDGKRAEVDETIEMLTGNLEKIAEHGKRADNIVKSMLEHSRGVSGERRDVDLNQLVEEALNLAYHGARAQDQTFNIALERDYAQNLQPIELAPQEITRVLLNLFGNGFYAANKRSHDNGRGSFRPTLIVATRDDSDAVEVRVRDNGTGIPPDIRDKLFQPFFTTKPTGEGTGLGLSISYDIVTQQHGGTITVDSRVGEYTEFTVRLPRH